MIESLCLKHVAERCLWLDYLILCGPGFKVVEVNNVEVVQVLEDKGCCVRFEVFGFTLFYFQV